MKRIVILAFAALALLHAQRVHASHGRGFSATWSISSAGVLTVECYSVWQSSSVSTPSFQVRTASNGGGTLVGTMTLSSTTNPSSTGSELSNQTFTIRKDVFTFNLSSQASGTYFAYWRSGQRISGISNISSSSSTDWEADLVVKYTSGAASSSPTISAANMETVLPGVDYNHNLNSTDPDGTTVTFELLTGSSSPDFASTTLISGINVTSGGVINIPAANTGALATGRYHYKVRATDASGATAERDVLIFLNPLTIATTTSALSYTAGDPATAVDPGVTIYQTAGGNITSATVSITGNFSSSEDTQKNFP